MGMANRFFRSFVLTTAVFSMLLWLYVVTRAVVNGANLNTPFIDAFPAISIWETGAFAFTLAFITTFIYIALWGDFDRRRKES
jgi:hypothetical protein